MILQCLLNAATIMYLYEIKIGRGLSHDNLCFRKIRYTPFGCSREQASGSSISRVEKRFHSANNHALTFSLLKELSKRLLNRLSR
jgi:hypothetical protein